MSKKCVVVFSGGQDSTTTLLNALCRYDEIHCVTFDYGQKHSIELEKAKDIVIRLNERFGDRIVAHKFIDASIINELTVSSLTRDIEIEVMDNGLPNSFVPARNIMFLTLSAMYAYQFGIEDVITGVNATDYSGYPDCRPEFVSSMETTLRTGMETKTRILTPLMNLTKAETWALAAIAGTVLDTVVRHNSATGFDGVEFVDCYSHTCYNGVDGGCGECPACKLRDAGLKEYFDNEEAVTASLIAKVSNGELFTR